MKSILFLFASYFITVSAFGQSDLTGLDISFESSVKSPAENMYTSFSADFSIVKEAEHYYAISNTKSYVGTTKEGEWKQQLSKDNLKAIQNFVDVLQKLPKQIPPMSYYNDRYKVNYKGEKWNISPNTNLLEKMEGQKPQSKLPILEFYATIFKAEIESLYQKRLAHKIKVNQLITRKWYFNPATHKEVKKGAELIFSITSAEDQTAFLIIQDDFSVQHSLIKEMDEDARIDIEYDLNDVNNEFMYLSMPYFDNFVERIDLENWETETSFYIVELTETTLKLKVAY